MDKLYCGDMPDTTRTARLPAARDALLDSAIAVQWAHTVGSQGTPPVRVAALPQAPGVYRFRDRAGRVLYIGRAVSLRRRVLSYWCDLGDRAHLAPMVARIARVEAVTCDSAHEAAWLERNLLEHRRLDVARAARREQPGRYAEDLRDGAVRLFASASVLVGELDQSGLQQHADVEVQVPGVDAEPLGELTVRELPVAFLAEHLQHTHAQRMAERL